MRIKVTTDTSNFNLEDINISDIIQNEIESTAYNIERKAKANAPIDTGNLRRSITSDIGNLEAEIGTNLEYASYVHDGTIHMEARPFLDEALESEIDGLEDRIVEEIMRLL